MRDIILIAGLIFFLYYSVFESNLFNNTAKETQILQNEWLNSRVVELQQQNVVFFVKETISKGETFYEIKVQELENESHVQIFDTLGNFQFSDEDLVYDSYQKEMTYEKILLDSNREISLGAI